jgi:hypothetical protein
LIQTNLDVGTNHSTAFINLGIDPNGSSVDIEADKITLGNSFTVDDVFTSTPTEVLILGTLAVGIQSDKGTGTEIGFKVETNGDITCNNLHANSGTFVGDITGSSGEFNGNVVVTTGFAEARYTAGSIIFDVLGDVSSIQPSLSGGNWGLKLSSGNGETRIEENLLVSGNAYISGSSTNVGVSTFKSPTVLEKGHKLSLVSGFIGNKHTMYLEIVDLLGSSSSSNQIACWVKTASSPRFIASVCYMNTSTSSSVSNSDGTINFNSGDGSASPYSLLYV